MTTKGRTPMAIPLDIRIHNLLLAEFPSLSMEDQQHVLDGLGFDLGYFEPTAFTPRTTCHTCGHAMRFRVLLRLPTGAEHSFCDTDCVRRWIEVQEKVVLHEIYTS
jgi:hypothetical protein